MVRDSGYHRERLLQAGGIQCYEVQDHELCRCSSREAHVRSLLLEDVTRLTENVDSGNTKCCGK